MSTPAGKLAQHQRFGGQQIGYEHDLDGRVTKKVTSEQKTYFFHWSPGGRLETVDDDPCNPSDAYGSFVYDARGRLSLEQREDGDKLAYAYDDGGNRTDVALAPRWAEPNKPTWKTHYTYDGLNRLKTVSEVLDPNGSAGTKLIGEYFYDAVGNLDHVTLGNGTAVEYGYDDLHRLTSVKNYRDYGGSAQTVISSFVYTLGDAGNRKAVVEQLSDGTRRTVGYTYDDLYRLKQEWADTRDANNLIVHERQVDYVCDKVGNRKTMTVRETAGGVTATYTVTYTYDAHDRLTRETRSGNCLTAAVYTRDRAEYAVAKSTQPVPARWAAPALLGFGLLTLLCTVFPLLSRTSWRPWRSRRLGGCIYGRRYERRRLWTACVALFFVPQFIIGASNVLGLHVEGLEAQALADAADCGRVVKYFYDANGNLNWRVTSKSGQPDDVDRYVFNSEDRLIAYDPNTPYDPNNPGDPNHAADPNNVSTAAARYTYDPDGVRTSKTTGTVTTYYVVDKNRDLPQVLEERDGAGALKVRYLYGHDLLAQVRPVGQSQEYSYYHYDGQLSTRQLTDDAAVRGDVAVTNNYTYDAFGADLTHTGLPGNSPGAPENLYRYTGEQHDPTTGFYYLRARYYDPATGRFASRDPLNGTDPASLHKYLYCGANPIDRADPSGRSFATIAVLFVGILILAILAILILSGLHALTQGFQHHTVTGSEVGGMKIDSQMTLLIPNMRGFVTANRGKIPRMRSGLSWGNARSAMRTSWDVKQLYDSGFHSASSNLQSAPDLSGHDDVFASGDSIPGTVTWKGMVFDADDVSYYFFGALIRALDDAEGVSTYSENRAKILAYRWVVWQGDKLLSRSSMFDCGYLGIDPYSGTSVGGAVPSTLPYPGKLNWNVCENDLTIATGEVP